MVHEFFEGFIFPVNIRKKLLEPNETGNIRPKFYVFVDLQIFRPFH